MVNRDEFLFELESLLAGLSKEEKQDILQDFEEHFAMGILEGKSEEEIVRALGSPQQIAKEMKAHYHIEKVSESGTVVNIARAVWAVIGLGFFNLIIVLGPLIAAVSIVCAGWIFSAGLALSPILVFMDAVIFQNGFNLFNLFFSILLAGTGILVGIGMYYVTRLFIKGLVHYLKFNVNIVKGGI